MKKKLLIYAHYYVPDIASTGQIIAELAEGLLDQFEVTVICVVPSYSGSIEEKYRKQKYYREEINGVNIIRVRVPEFNKGDKLSRIRNIMTYFFRAMKATFMCGKQQYILSVSQPPILGGLLGVFGKWIKACKYIYQIQDFNPEQILAINYSKNKLITSVMLTIDKFSCRRANLVITVGSDLVETLEKRFETHPDKMPKVSLINNWVDEREIYPLEADAESMVDKYKKVISFKREYGLEDKFVIMYSGNIGLYYDLDNIIKVIEKFKPGTKTVGVHPQEVVFVFVGEGSLLDKLVIHKEKHNMDNVIFIPYQDKKDLNYSLNAGDVHWCVNAKGIKGISCPSKYYGLAAAGKPVLGVLEEGSEIRRLIKKTNGGLISEPGDYKKIEENILWLIKNADSKELKEMGRRNREYLLANLTKEKSVNKYAIEILKL